MAIRRARSTAFVPLLLSLAAWGCGSEESQAPAPAPAAPAAPAAPTPADEPERQEPPAAAVPAPAAVEEGPEWARELPVDFPADVPHYPGSQVTSAKGTEELGFAVTFDSPDGLDTIARFYADEFATKGWQAEMQQIPEGAMIVAEKEGRQANAVVHPGGQGTLVDLIVVRVE